MAELEYFYAGYSGYAYLGSRRFMQIARESGNEIKHRPFDLRYLLDHNGCQPFDERTEAYNSYFFVREIERWSEYRNAPIAKAFPTYHSNSIEPSNKMLIAAMDLGYNIDEFSCVMMEQHWRYDCDLADMDTLTAIASCVGLDPIPLMEHMKSEQVDKIYRANTDEAVAKGMFGSPTYIVDGDPIYGQDHLEIVERALRKPFLFRFDTTNDE